MSSLYKRKPTTAISIHKCLSRGASMSAALPAHLKFLPANFAAELADADTLFNQLYRAKGVAEGNYRNNNNKLSKSVEKLRLFISHFVQVLNFAIARGEDNFAPGDLKYYTLPDTKVPNLKAEESVFFWADNLLKGENNRLANKPGAVPMGYPSAAQLLVHYTAASNFLALENQLATNQNEANAALKKSFKKSKLTVNKLWNYLHIQYLDQPAETRREIMREWGVVYVSRGIAASLTGMVKNPEGKPLEGVVITLGETGAKTTTNSDGRYTLRSTFVGKGELQFAYPGANDINIGIEITKHKEAAIIELEDVVVG